MTEKVAPVMEQMRVLAEETRNEALDGLAAADRELLIDLLTEVRANISERTPPPRAAAPESKAG
jgi:hypothetical protein